jgi:hypothetical protein
MIEVANAQGKGLRNSDDPNLKGGPVAKVSVTVTDAN